MRVIIIVFTFGSVPANAINSADSVTMSLLGVELTGGIITWFTLVIGAKALYVAIITLMIFLAGYLEPPARSIILFHWRR